MTARQPATVLLVRHAETDPMRTRLTGRLAGVPLNAAGVRQAADLGRRLAGAHLDAIHSSPLQRARATAGAIAAQLDLAVQIDPELTEIEFGEWTGLTFTELSEREDWRSYNAARSTARIPRGESPDATVARIAAALARLQVRHPGGTIAVVTHAELIRYAVLQARRIPLDDWSAVDVPPASVTILECGPGPLRLEQLATEGGRRST